MAHPVSLTFPSIYSQVLAFTKYHRHCLSVFLPENIMVCQAHFQITATSQSSGMHMIHLMPLMVLYGHPDSILWSPISTTESRIPVHDSISHSDLRPRRTLISQHFDIADKTSFLSEFLGPCHQTPHLDLAREYSQLLHLTINLC